MQGEAANSAIRMAEVLGVPLYLVHCSCEDALEVVKRARGEGQRVFAEAGDILRTCIQPTLNRLTTGIGKFARARIHALTTVLGLLGHHELSPRVCMRNHLQVRYAPISFRVFFLNDSPARC
jgi:hypothetical protein